MAEGKPESVPLHQLGIEELANVHQQLEQEMNAYMQNMLALQQTATRFASAGQSVEYMQDQKPGQPVMLPLTESLYVSGTLESVDNVLLEIGTGYYIEKDLDGSVDYCKRKVLFVKDKIDELTKLIQQRRGMQQQVVAVIEAKQQQQQQQKK